MKKKEPEETGERQRETDKAKKNDKKSEKKERE